MKDRILSPEDRKDKVSGEKNDNPFLLIHLDFWKPWYIIFQHTTESFLMNQHQGNVVQRVQSSASQSGGLRLAASASPESLSKSSVLRSLATSGLKPRICVLPRSPGDSGGGGSLKATGSKHTDFRTEKQVQRAWFNSAGPGSLPANSVKITYFFPSIHGTIL